TGADRVFYAGDDTTDEDAFAVLQPGDVGLKIGAGDSLAGYRVRGPEDVPLVLGLIADQRAAVAAEREAAAGAGA
ncbi:MAG TPA: trehalose-phosphatase, partial [Cryobacterium sp.]|nr:trehalose-phosphatase [Cryobacterium sp.]